MHLNAKTQPIRVDDWFADKIIFQMNVDLDRKVIYTWRNIDLKYRLKQADNGTTPSFHCYVTLNARTYALLSDKLWRLVEQPLAEAPDIP